MWYVGVWCVCGVFVCALCVVCVRCVCVPLSDRGEHVEAVLSEPRLGEGEGTLLVLQGKAFPAEGPAGAEPRVLQCLRSSQEAVRAEPAGSLAAGAGREQAVLFSRPAGSSSPFSAYRTRARHRLGVGIRELVRG